MPACRLLLGPPAPAVQFVQQLQQGAPFQPPSVRSFHLRACLAGHRTLPPRHGRAPLWVSHDPSRGDTATVRLAPLAQGVDRAARGRGARGVGQPAGHHPGWLLRAAAAQEHLRRRAHGLRRAQGAAGAPPRRGSLCWGGALFRVWARSSSHSKHGAFRTCMVVDGCGWDGRACPRLGSRHLLSSVLRNWRTWAALPWLGGLGLGQGHGCW